MKRFALVGVLALLCGSALAQVTFQDQNSAIWGLNGALSGTTLKLPDSKGTINNQFEVKVNGTAPSTLTVTIAGCMRGGTCGSTLATSSGTASQILTPSSSNIYDNYAVTTTWTGGDATTQFVINRSGTTGGGGGGATSAVSVSNFPNPQNVSVTNTSTSATQTITTNQCAGPISLNGTGSVVAYITAVSGVFSAGNLLVKAAPDSLTFNPAQVQPFMPTSGGSPLSSIPFGSWAAGASWTANLGPTGSFEVCGDGTLAGGTSVSVFVGAGQSSQSEFNGSIDASGNLKVNVSAGSFIPGTTLALGLNNATNTSLTTAVVAKASTGNLYGFSVNNGAASVCYLEFINASSAPTLGTNAIFSVAVPATSSVTIMPGSFGVNFSTGISYGLATAYNGSTACGTAGAASIFYK